MGAFYSYKIFSHPRIKELTYFLRLDDDSSILAPTCNDPFEYMHAHNKSYAFRGQHDGVGWVTDGMWSFVSNYAARQPAVEAQMRVNNWEWPPGRVWPGPDYARDVNFPSYQTNIDLVKVPRFRTSEMLAFLDELASDPRRFYWYRWGTSVDLVHGAGEMLMVRQATRRCGRHRCPCFWMPRKRCTTCVRFSTCTRLKFTARIASVFHYHSRESVALP